MQGMDRHTGKPLAGTGHLRQSIEDILSTPFVTRLMRLYYGSDVPGIIDAPMNTDTSVGLFIAVAEALRPKVRNGKQYGEPRFDLQRIAVTNVTSGGKMQLSLTGRIVPDVELTTLQVAA